jgi:poly [ADP-ribose] polymerase
MKTTIEFASTNRSKCRSCKNLIAKDDVRYGEEVESFYGDGDMTTLWYHLNCASTKKAKNLQGALAKYKGKSPSRTEIDQLLKSGVNAIASLSAASASASTSASVSNSSSPSAKRSSSKSSGKSKGKGSK